MIEFKKTNKEDKRGELLTTISARNTLALSDQFEEKILMSLVQWTNQEENHIH
jgi:hypothetical protein